MNERVELHVPAVPAPEPVADAVIPDAVISDADIVARVLTGDSALFELLMRRYNRLLFRLARGIVRDDDEAMDVVQAAYVSAYYHLDQFRGPSGFKAWLARIAVNEALGRARRERPGVDADPRCVLALPDLVTIEPENAASDRDLLRSLQAAIDQTRFHRARRLLQELLQRELGDVVRGTFPFDGQRCDAIVGAVLARIRRQ
jgi:RNA polymerase sigma-70 factor (ECF subfamily)